MFEFAFVGVANGNGSSVVRFDGALSTTSASSPVTSSTRTINGACTLIFTATGGGTSGGAGQQYSKNGGAFTNITESLTLAMAASDTLAVRATIGTSTQTSTFSLFNNDTSALIEDVVLIRS